VTDDEAEEFSAFVAGRSPALLRTAYLLTGDAHAAEDLVQTALLRTLRHWRRIRDRQSLDSFVRQVTVNERLAWFRRRSSSEVATGVDQHPDDVAARAPTSPAGWTTATSCAGGWTP
jgi:DNA-directed RNA polymerase specialized sigma24 family protein